MYSENNNEKEGKAIRKSKEKQVRIIARKKRNEKKNKEEKREHRDNKENGEYRKTERLKSEVRKQECDRGMHH